MQGSIKAEKQRIRKEARMISEGLTGEYRAEASREIIRQVLDLPFWKEAGTVMAYWSLPEEPDTREIMETALREGKTLLLPRCVDATRMIALPVSDLSEPKAGTMGIPEPEMPGNETVSAPEPDLILVPCVAAGWDMAPDITTDSWRNIRERQSAFVSGRSCGVTCLLKERILSRILLFRTEGPAGIDEAILLRYTAFNLFLN